MQNGRLPRSRSRATGSTGSGCSENTLGAQDSGGLSVAYSVHLWRAPLVLRQLLLQTLHYLAADAHRVADLAGVAHVAEVPSPERPGLEDALGPEPLV